MRRRWLLPAGLSLLVGCASTPRPEAGQVVGEEVHYESGGVSLKGYLAYDAAGGEARPGVLVVHEWLGHNDYVRRRARMLAEAGYTALALDMYGDGKVAEHPGDARTFVMEVLADMDVAVARFEAAQRLLEEHPTTDPEQVAAIGYCFGGAVALHMARSGLDLDGVASFHGNLATQSPAQPGRVRAELLVLHGGADPLVPAEEVAAFEDEMAAAAVDYELIVYPDVLHAFTNPEATAFGAEFGLPLAYDPQADEHSWAALEAFLAKVFDR